MTQKQWTEGTRSLRKSLDERLRELLAEYPPLSGPQAESLKGIVGQATAKVVAPKAQGKISLGRGNRYFIGSDGQMRSQAERDAARR